MKKGISLIVVGLVVLMGSLVSAQHESTTSTAALRVDMLSQHLAALNNSPPSIPVIAGTTKGKHDVGYNFTFTSTDPDGDNVFYWIEWGDGCPQVGWLGPYTSGQTITVSHTFPRGTWNISCQAKDIYNATSEFGFLKVSMPLGLQAPAHGLLAWLLARFPHAFPILRTLLGY